MPTGVSEVDALLEGGLPFGAMTEMAGMESTGRTGIGSILLSVALYEWSGREDLNQRPLGYE